LGENNGLCSNDFTQSACSFQCNFAMLQCNITTYIGSFLEKVAKLIICSEGLQAWLVFWQFPVFIFPSVSNRKSNCPMIDIFIKRLQKIGLLHVGGNLISKLLQSLNLHYKLWLMFLILRYGSLHSNWLFCPSLQPVCVLSVFLSKKQKQELKLNWNLATCSNKVTTV